MGGAGVSCDRPADPKRAACHCGHPAPTTPEPLCARQDIHEQPDQSAEQERQAGGFREHLERRRLCTTQRYAPRFGLPDTPQEEAQDGQDAERQQEAAAASGQA